MVYLFGVKKIIIRDGMKLKVDCCFLDLFGLIKLILWEDLIIEVVDDNIYNFCNFKVMKDNDNYFIYFIILKYDCFILLVDFF